MRHIVVGTAGHVDHGKTALVKALTGIDTDRLKEEKLRGITIELGFAFLKTASGQTLGVVDVPGHERFIRNMVAGAAGIDLVVLVIAADEGVMPQTREHLAICTFLGIRRGLVALTKIDMVDRDWLDLVTEDVRQFLLGTFLEGSPVVPVSALTGEGLPDVLAAIEDTAALVEEETDAGLFRLPVDRVFTMRGFGTVVTGTVATGRIAVGEEVVLLPPGQKARVRGIQIHNESMPTAEAGQRAAINLQGLDRDAVERGEVLARPGTIEPTRRVDAVFQYLAGPEKKLKNRTLVRFHTGTSETMARLLLPEGSELSPGRQAPVQFYLENPVVALAGDRYVVRSYSPVTTLGGGTILDPLARKHKAHGDKSLGDFDILSAGDEAERVSVILDRSGFAGTALNELVVRTGLPETLLRKTLEKLFTDRRAILMDREEWRAVSRTVHEDVQERILRTVRVYHEKNPLKEGIPREELRSTAGSYIPPKLFASALRDLEKTGRLLLERDTVRLAEHRVDWQGSQEDLRGEILQIYQEAGYAPPTVREFAERFRDRKREADKILGVLIQEGILVRINEDLHFHRDALARLREDYRAFLLKAGKANPTDFKDLTGLSRKFIIPLMEYFDQAKLTIRVGDHRVLREKEKDDRPQNGTR
ncbi:MAG: selenocysteine-specific translation elongation factor [Syntrophaceae bacterium]|nr:selenocysteine-specific translation elongation factor [Syntrophaceae bacterium]